MDQSLEDLKAENAQLKRDLELALAHQATASEQDARRYNFIEAMLDTMPIGVVMAEAPSGKIVMGNKRTEDLVRHPVYESEDTASYGEWISFHEDGRRVESHEYPLARVIGGGEDYAELDVNYQRGDGTMFWMRIICRPVLDGNGEMIGASVALIDIDNERHLLEQQDILIAELNHRVKNAFTVVKSIVSQSLRNTEASNAVRDTIDHRLDAYAQAHSKLIGNHWDRASILDIATDTVGHIAGGRITMSGPTIEVPSRSVMALSMAFYELATNAMKHGSLSDPNGRVELVWQIVAPGQISLNWVERNGPVPVVPTTKGFGSKIINQILVAETQGKVSIDYPESGFEWSLTMPIKDKG
ncbi:HWE histidine kinase domain-containing protein [Sulfitobacter sp. HNIBRBA2951]|uniref:HWE histidine kinase domain-containing protein n=1 Tax=Sulfitobacter aquimarinus TaxID=3158557 RepID=UPI0032DF0A59